MIADYDNAILNLQKAVDQDPGFWPSHFLMAASYDAKGMKEQFVIAAKKVLKENKNILHENWEQKLPYKDPAQTEKFVEILKKIETYK